MRLMLEEFTELYAKEICNWKYDGEYSIYNYPSWTKALDNKWAITIEEKRKKEFFAVIDEDYKLCGYIRLQEENECILVGVGLKPSLCGQRLGDTLIAIKEQDL